MLTRKVFTASAAAAALVALSVPPVNAQDDGLATGDSESGSLPLGSIGSGSDEGTSLGDLTPESDEVCELPGLGGSVAKFYPLFGIEGVPTGVLDLITSALDSFPNLLDVVTGEGGGTALIGEAGSLSEGLCTSIFGGEMVLPPVTVIVDGDGAPVTTVTGTSTIDGSGSLGSVAGSSAAAAAVSASAAGDAGTDSAGHDEIDASEHTLPTSVPVPVA